MTKNNFVKTAQSINVVINGMPLLAKPKSFKTGSVGYNVSGKVPVTLPNGEIVKLQVSGNLTVIGSKAWEPGEAVTVTAEELETEEEVA